MFRASSSEVQLTGPQLVPALLARRPDACLPRRRHIEYVSDAVTGPALTETLRPGTPHVRPAPHQQSHRSDTAAETVASDDAPACRNGRMRSPALQTQEEARRASIGTPAIRPQRVWRDGFADTRFHAKRGALRAPLLARELRGDGRARGAWGVTPNREGAKAGGLAPIGHPKPSLVSPEYGVACSLAKRAR